MNGAASLERSLLRSSALPNMPLDLVTQQRVGPPTGLILCCYSSVTTIARSQLQSVCRL